jgi:hypothetical protein
MHRQQRERHDERARAGDAPSLGSVSREEVSERLAAALKPCTNAGRPGTIFAESIIKNAFITKENKPNVITVIGKAIIFTIGFIKMLIIPNTIANTIELTIVTLTPFNK